MNIDYFEMFLRLDRKLQAIWQEIFNTSQLVHAIATGSIDKRLYVRYMMETFHYTLHNAKS
jgi:hypothetical protein